jgi:hypothetical protein
MALGQSQSSPWMMKVATIEELGGLRRAICSRDRRRKWVMVELEWENSLLSCTVGRGVRHSNGQVNRSNGFPHRLVFLDDRVGLGSTGLGPPIMLGGKYFLNAASLCVPIGKT